MELNHRRTNDCEICKVLYDFIAKHVSSGKERCNKTLCDVM